MFSTFTIRYILFASVLTLHTLKTTQHFSYNPHQNLLLRRLSYSYCKNLKVWTIHSFPATYLSLRDTDSTDGLVTSRLLRISISVVAVFPLFFSIFTEIIGKMDIDHDKSGHDDTEHSVLNYVKDISNTNVSKQKFIESLKYDYEKVQTEVQSKMEELKKLKESNCSLNSYLNSHKFMMNELQKTEEADASEIHINRETVLNLRDEMAKLKQIRNEDLICYEEKVTNMTKKFIDGPFNCDPSLLTGKMTKLLEIQTDVRKELENIQKDLEIVRKKFNLEQAPFISQGATRLQTLQETVEEENAELVVENEKLNNEIKSLGKTAKGLQQEIDDLKQQHRFDK